MHRWLSTAVIATALLAAPAAAQITPGSTFTFRGVANASDIGLGGVMLDFSPKVIAAASANTGSFGVFNTDADGGMSGDVAGIRVGNGDNPVANFLTLGGFRFSIASLPSGMYAQDACYVEPELGQTCTPFQSVQGDPAVNAGMSPFYVANLDSGDPDAPMNSTAAFALLGTVTGPDGYVSTFTGTVASSFVGLPYQYVLYTLEQDGLQDVTFTGRFVAGPVIGRTDAVPPIDTAVTPEPATYALLGFGLAGVAGVSRRRKART